MKTITAPKISANEDEIQVVEKFIKENQYCHKNHPICLLESTKSTFEIHSEEDGFVLLIVDVGETVSVGQILGYQNSEKIEHIDKFKEYLNSKHSNINFTSEIETDGKLPFLDNLIERKIRFHSIRLEN